MGAINYKAIASDYRNHGARPVCRELTEAIGSGQLKPEDFSLRELAESLVENGTEWIRSLDPSQGVSVLENDAVDSTAFKNITGQIVFSAMMEGYNSPGYVISSLFRNIPTRLNGEKIPGIGQLGDKTGEVHEGMPYPRVGIGEDYIETPPTIKKGLIVPLTKEAIFFDRTGLVLQRARDVGESIRINKEKRCVDVLIGSVNNYKWRGTGYNTYLSSGTPWTNLLTGVANDLVDWTSLEAVELLFADIKDPNTDEPVVIMPNTIVATPFKKNTIGRVLTATEVRHKTDAGNTETLASNPLSGYSPVISQYVYSRLQSQLGLTAAEAKATYFLGDFSKAFAYMENWGITTTQAPQNSEAEFDRDIIAQFKASERGVPVVWNPRYAAKVSGHA